MAEREDDYDPDAILRDADESSFFENEEPEIPAGMEDPDEADALERYNDSLEDMDSFE